MAGYSMSWGGLGGGASYSYSNSTMTVEEAKLECHILAYKGGSYSLPLLKEKWWQVFRQKEYTDFEQLFLQAITDRDLLNYQEHKD